MYLKMHTPARRNSLAHLPFLDILYSTVLGGETGITGSWSRIDFHAGTDTAVFIGIYPFFDFYTHRAEIECGSAAHANVFLTVNLL